ncbi:uncharacterized protein LOC105216589 [Zeugodacus cucurbitae]|uniref:uncharacterized protein LOC105216589 n=1 Tax=Zeugodacus cucurbitae TaxID=28588 RepID=UPI0005969C13|nr:uncharacterized protein LOC105216589 [Zeugodacus cucurbitae]
MSRLSYAAKIWIQPHRLASTITTLKRVISTTAPNPNFGHRELPLPNETVHVFEKTTNDSAPKDINNNDVNDNATIDEGKPPAMKENKLPEMTIVDIDSGYGRMDFEDRMEHMDLVDRINEAKQSNNVDHNTVLPLVRTMPTVVNIDGYGDDMMYEQPELILPQTTTEEEAAEETAEEAKPVADEVTKAVPMAAEAVAVAIMPQQQTVIDAEEVIDTQEATKETIALENQTSVEKTVEAASASPTITKTTNDASDVEYICEAPVDIDAFANEQEKKQGTVDIDAYGDDERFKLPPIPKDRNNVFEFKGIKIIMPKRMLRESTYRYRLDAADKDKADDMQICVYEK